VASWGVLQRLIKFNIMGLGFLPFKRCFKGSFTFNVGIFQYLGGISLEFILIWSFCMQTRKACLITICRTVTSFCQGKESCGHWWGDTGTNYIETSIRHECNGIINLGEGCYYEVSIYENWRQWKGFLSIFKKLKNIIIISLTI